MIRPMVLLLVVLDIGFSNAHHGLTNYDTGQLIELEGIVTDFHLMDPHSILVVDVENPDGTRTLWDIEGGSAGGLVSSGLTREYLRSRPRVQVEGYQTRDRICAPRCRMAGEDFKFIP